MDQIGLRLSKAKEYLSVLLFETYLLHSTHRVANTLEYSQAIGPGNHHLDHNDYHCHHIMLMTIIIIIIKIPSEVEVAPHYKLIRENIPEKKTFLLRGGDLILTLL